MYKRKNSKGIFETRWTELKEEPVTGTYGINLSVQTYLTHCLSDESKAKPSINGFVQNLKLLVRVCEWQLLD